MKVGIQIVFDSVTGAMDLKVTQGTSIVILLGMLAAAEAQLTRPAAQKSLIELPPGARLTDKRSGQDGILR